MTGPIDSLLLAFDSAATSRFLTPGFRTTRLYGSRARQCRLSRRSVPSRPRDSPRRSRSGSGRGRSDRSSIERGRHMNGCGQPSHDVEGREGAERTPEQQLLHRTSSGCRRLEGEPLWGPPRRRLSGAGVHPRNVQAQSNSGRQTPRELCPCIDSGKSWSPKRPGG